MAVAGSTLLKNCNMHVNATAYHLSLSWSGKVKHRFVNEINITLVSFLHPIPDQRQPWMLLVKIFLIAKVTFQAASQLSCHAVTWRISIVTLIL